MNQIALPLSYRHSQEALAQDRAGNDGTAAVFARWAGESAYSEDRDLDNANPFEPYTELHRLWREGWKGMKRITEERQEQAAASTPWWRKD